MGNTAKSKQNGTVGVYKTVLTDMDLYLKKRSDEKSDAYQLCYPVPRELQSIFKKRYVRKSTGTADLRTARRVAAQLVAQCERTFQSAYAKLSSGLDLATAVPPQLANMGLSPTLPVVSLTAELIADLCERWRVSHLQTDDAERDDDFGLDDIKDIGEYAQNILSDAKEITIVGKNASSFVYVKEEACDWADMLGFCILDGQGGQDPLLAEYVKKFAMEKASVAKALLARNEGEVTPTPSLSKRFQGMSIQEYKPIWMKERIAGNDPSTVMLYAGRIDQFEQFLGKKFPEMKGTTLRAIEGRHVQAFTSYLLMDEKLKTSSVQNGHIPALRSFFSYALSDGHVEIDPCANVKLSKISKKDDMERARPRHPFEIGFLNKLFASAWYGHGPRGIKESPIYADVAARYWIPLILLAQGFRPVECCQFSICDIVESAGLLSFDVTDSGEGQTVKTDATRRAVPVSERLLELGFAEFVERRKKEGRAGDRLFPVMEGREEPAKWFTQQFNRFIRPSLDAPATYTPNSFRHTWEDMRRGARSKYGMDRWPLGMHFQIAGREDIEREEGSAKDYGSKYKAAQMKPFLNLIWNEEIILPMKFSDFEATAFVSSASRKSFKAYIEKVKG